MALINVKDKVMSYRVTQVNVKWLPEEKFDEDLNMWMNHVYYQIFGEFLKEDGTGNGKTFQIEQGNEWLPSDARNWEKDASNYIPQIDAILGVWGLQFDETKGIDFGGGIPVLSAAAPSVPTPASES